MQYLISTIGDFYIKLEEEKEKKNKTKEEDRSGLINRKANECGRHQKLDNEEEAERTKKRNERREKQKLT